MTYSFSYLSTDLELDLRILQEMALLNLLTKLYSLCTKKILRLLNKEKRIQDWAKLMYVWASLVTQLVKNPPAVQETGFNPWAGNIPWSRERLPTPVFWPGKFHGLYTPWGGKESDKTEQLSLSLDICLDTLLYLY